MTITATEIPAPAKSVGPRPYRLWTVEHIEFDALPAYRDGGPAMVTVTPWYVSTSSLCPVFSSPSVVAADDGMVTLNIHRVCHELPGYVTEGHVLDGTKYPTDREANRAAFRGGCLAFMVYDDEAERYGLPLA